MNLGGSIRLNKFAIFVSLFLITFILYVFQFNSDNLTALKIRFEMNYVNLTELLIAAIEVANLGGEEVIRSSQLRSRSQLKVQLKGRTLEGVNDSVTDADYASHCQMVYSLKNSFPNIQVVSEENLNYSNCFLNRKLKPITFDGNLLKNGKINGASFANIRDILIWIDPLDATKEFIEGLHEYVTTMVCISIKGKPIIGVIHKPFTNETYWIWINHGQSNQFSNRKPSPSNNKTVLVSLSHSGDVTDKVYQYFGKNANIIKAAGSGYKVLEVAVGNASAYVHSTLIKKWDICAGNAIINGLGGKMTTLHDAIIDYSDPNLTVNQNGLIVKP